MMYLLLTTPGERSRIIRLACPGSDLHKPTKLLLFLRLPTLPRPYAWADSLCGGEPEASGIPPGTAFGIAVDEPAGGPIAISVRSVVPGPSPIGGETPMNQFLRSVDRDEVIYRILLLFSIAFTSLQAYIAMRDMWARVSPIVLRVIQTWG